MKLHARPCKHGQGIHDVPQSREERKKGTGSSAVGVASGRPRPDDRKKEREENLISFLIVQKSPSMSDLSIALDSLSKFFVFYSISWLYCLVVEFITFPYRAVSP